MLKSKRFALLLLIVSILCPFLPSGAQDKSGQTVSPAINAVSPKSASTTVIRGESDPAAIEILDRYIAAIGGQEAWDSVKAQQVEAEFHLLGLSVRVTTVHETATKKTYTKVETPRGVVELGFDGQRVWQRSPALHGYMADTDPQAQMLKSPTPELRDFRRNQESYSRLPDETIDGRKYQVLTTTRQVLGQEVPVKCYFDPDTHLATRTTVGNVTLAVVTFSDYRSVEGRLIPFLVSTSTGMGGDNEIKILSYKLNPEYSPSIFEFEPAKVTNAAEPSPAPISSGLLAKQPATSPLIKPYKNDEIIPEAVRLDTFELVWRKINDSYWDKNFGGLDWKAVHEQYLPRAKETGASGDFHNLLNQMLGLLKSSHFRVDPPANVLRLDVTEKEIKNGSLGIGLRWIDNQLLITYVRKDYPAERAGLRLGYVVTQINGKTPEKMLSEYRAKHAGFELRPELTYRSAAYSEIGGSPGDKIALDVLDEKDKHAHVDLVLKAVPLDEDFRFESRKLKGNLGYIEFGAFFGDVLDKVQRALADLHGTDGLILDLRGNPGGLIELAPNIANLLCSSPGSLGTFAFRYEKQVYSFKGSGTAAYRGKIVVLVDEASASSAEILSGGLQELGRVTVIGSRTAGAVLSATEAYLPTGGTLQYVISNFETPKGITLEGRGVLPQVEAHASRQSLLAGRDAPLDSATEFLARKSSN